MLPFLFFFCYVYRNLLPLIEILNDLSKNISPFSFHSVLKKVSFILKLRFVSRKICSTRNGERSFRTKGSASLIFLFLNVIILCAHLYIRSSFALHLPPAAAQLLQQMHQPEEITAARIFFFSFPSFSTQFFFLLSLSLSYSRIHIRKLSNELCFVDLKQ